MPYSDDKDHSPSEFYYPGKQMTKKNTPENFSSDSVFMIFYTKLEQIAIQQGHIINPLLTSFARSVRKSIAVVFYRADLASSSHTYVTLRSDLTFPALLAVLQIASSSRFVDFSEDDIIKFCDKQENENTAKTTSYDIVIYED